MDLRECGRRFVKWLGPLPPESPAAILSRLADAIAAKTDGKFRGVVSTHEGGDGDRVWRLDLGGDDAAITVLTVNSRPDMFYPCLASGLLLLDSSPLRVHDDRALERILSRSLNDAYLDAFVAGAEKPEEPATVDSGITLEALRAANPADFNKCDHAAEDAAILASLNPTGSSPSVEPAEPAAVPHTRIAALCRLFAGWLFDRVPGADLPRDGCWSKGFGSDVVVDGKTVGGASCYFRAAAETIYATCTGNLLCADGNRALELRLSRPHGETGWRCSTLLDSRGPLSIPDAATLETVISACYASMPATAPPAAVSHVGAATPPIPRNPDSGRTLARDARGKVGGLLLDMVNHLPNLGVAADFRQIVAAVARAQSHKKPIVVAVGVDTLLAGCGPYIADWVRSGFIVDVVMTVEAALLDVQLSRGDWTGKFDDDVSAMLSRAAKPSAYDDPDGISLGYEFARAAHVASQKTDEVAGSIVHAIVFAKTAKLLLCDDEFFQRREIYWSRTATKRRTNDQTLIESSLRALVDNDGVFLNFDGDRSLLQAFFATGAQSGEKPWTAVCFSKPDGIKPIIDAQNPQATTLRFVPPLELNIPLLHAAFRATLLTTTRHDRRSDWVQETPAAATLAAALDAEVMKDFRRAVAGVDGATFLAKSRTVTGKPVP